MMHPQIHELDNELRGASLYLSQEIDDIPDEVEKPKAIGPIIDEALFNKLKNWRTQRATAEKLPAYIVAHDKALSAVAAAKPTTAQQLLGVSGFGAKKVEVYGPDIIAVVVGHTSQPQD